MSIGMDIMCSLLDEAQAKEEAITHKNDRQKYLNQYLNKKPEPMSDILLPFTKSERKT